MASAMGRVRCEHTPLSMLTIVVFPTYRQGWTLVGTMSQTRGRFAYICGAGVYVGYRHTRHSEDPVNVSF